MTDETLKDLVLKHDNTIGELATSVTSLVESNVETNKRLEEISRYLAKQAVFDTKLESLDRELSDSFKRVHKRVDNIETTQNSGSGCKSVQLLTKDVDAHAKEVAQLANNIGDNKVHLETIEKKLNTIPSLKTTLLVAGVALGYITTFGAYVVLNIHKQEVEITKISEHIISRNTVNEKARF